MKRKVSPILALVVGIVALSLPACARIHGQENEEGHEEHHTIIVTSPKIMDVVITRPYVCQIHSCKHIDIRALDEGYLEDIRIKEGQRVDKDAVLFKVLPVLYARKYDAEVAEANLAEIKYEQTKKLASGPNPVVSPIEVKLYEAEWKKAQAKMNLSKAELDFTNVTAPFTGIVDRQLHQLGSLIKKDEVLTTLSDNSLMWVYFNVPEAQYLKYKAHEKKTQAQDVSHLTIDNAKIELRLANGTIFNQTAGNTVTVEGNFNNKTGNIPFRADFPNPDRLLRHGQTGTVLIHQTVHNAVVIPQRATFEFLDKQYVWVVADDHVAHQRLITIEHGLEDEFVVSSGLGVNDKIIVEGVRQVREGDKVEYEFHKPAEVLAHQKNPAE